MGLFLLLLLLTFYSQSRKPGDRCWAQFPNEPSCSLYSIATHEFFSIEVFPIDQEFLLTEFDRTDCCCFPFLLLSLLSLLSQTAYYGGSDGANKLPPLLMRRSSDRQMTARRRSAVLLAASSVYGLGNPVPFFPFLPSPIFFDR